MPDTPPRIAIVGRPNVGKSTLLNRIVGRREAIVEERPGVTRDRKTVLAEWQGREFEVTDTGGWLVKGDSLDRKVSAQAEEAIAEADVVVVVVDVTVGVTDEDERVARIVRRTGRPVMLVANKVDHAHHEPEMWAFTRLGLGEPVPLSALHGRNAGDFLDQLVAMLPPPGSDFVLDSVVDAPIQGVGQSEHSTPAIAIVGRPNVGKSTLFNRLIGDERSVVHDRPGTTRDSIDTVLETPEGPLRFIDTAGMRRRSRVDEPTEYYSVVRALRSVDEADAALLVIDATEGVTHQDQRLAERVDASGCPIVVLLNKWDLIDDDERRQDVLAQLGDRLRFLDYSPVLQISALSGRGVHRLIPAVEEAVAQYHRRVPTAELNRVVREAQASHPAPGGARVLYATQGATDPPTITLFANRTLPRTWLRYVERRIREHFDLGATPVKIRVRRRSE
jgi:GTP-binding protein